MVRLLQETINEWMKDRVSTLSAALSYYAIFSIGPLLLVIISIISFFYGRQAVEGQIVHQLTDLLGKETALTIQNLLKQTYQQQNGLIPSLIGVVTLLLGAIGIFGQLKDSLNHIWKVTIEDKKGIQGFVLEQVLSFAMVFAISLFIIFSLIVTSILSALSKYFQSGLDLPVQTLEIANICASFLLVTILFTCIYKILPNTKVPWRAAVYGAILASILFTLGKTLIGIYIGSSVSESTYGAASSLIALLLWVFYSSQILFLGAEFTKVYTRSLKH